MYLFFCAPIGGEGVGVGIVYQALTHLSGLCRPSRALEPKVFEPLAIKLRIKN